MDSLLLLQNMDYEIGRIQSWKHWVLEKVFQVPVIIKGSFFKKQHWNLETVKIVYDS